MPDQLPLLPGAPDPTPTPAPALVPIEVGQVWEDVGTPRRGRRLRVEWVGRHRLQTRPPGGGRLLTFRQANFRRMFRRVEASDDAT